MAKGARRIVGLLRSALREWLADKCPRLAAALAYYTLFAMAPLLLIVVAIASLALDGAAAREAVIGEVRALVGPDGADIARTALERAQAEGRGGIAAVAGLLGLAIGATGVFVELQSALNTVWGLQAPQGKAFLRIVRERLTSLAMVLVLGFILLLSLVVSAALAALSARLGAGLGGWALVAFRAADAVLSVAAVTVLVAAIYKVLPDARIRWREVWTGAAITAVLLTLGKAALGLYLGRGAVGSAFGGAGALAVLLAWVYYAGLIFFFGAEFTQVYADRQGRVEPRRGAVYVGRAPSRQDVPPADG